MDRLVAAHERFMLSTLRLLVVPGPDNLATLVLESRPDRPTTLTVPIPPLDGLNFHDFLGPGVVDKVSGRSNVLLSLVQGGEEGDQAARLFCALAAESGRLYQTLPAHIAPVHGTTSPRNLWSTVLCGWLQGTSWVQQAEGYEFIPLPFAASAELWRRLLYGTTPDGRVQAGACPLSPGDELPEAVDDLPAYNAEEQAWWTPLPRTKDVQSEELLSLTNDIDVVLITATDTESEAVLRQMEPLPRRQAVLKGFPEQETYYLGKFGAYMAAVTKCRMGSLDSGGARLATQHAQRVWGPRAIIMVGIAFGGDSKKQKIADVLVASQVISYEPQRVGEKQVVNRGPSPPTNPTLLNRFDNVPGWSFRRPDGSKCKREVGPMLSGEKLVDAAAFKAALLDRYPQAIGGDMEGVGLAAAAVRHGVPWILVKAICDWADGKKDKKHQPLAAAAAVSLVHYVLSQRDVLHGLEKPSRS
jgi:nucleoside phosphorylase